MLVVLYAGDAVLKCQEFPPSFASFASIKHMWADVAAVLNWVSSCVEANLSSHSQAGEHRSSETFSCPI